MVKIAYVISKIFLFKPACACARMHTLVGCQLVSEPPRLPNSNSDRSRVFIYRLCGSLEFIFFITEQGFEFSFSYYRNWPRERMDAGESRHAEPQAAVRSSGVDPLSLRL